MQNSGKYRSLLLSFGIIAVLIPFVFLLFYSNENPLGPYFNFYVLLISLHYFGLIAGAIVMLMRLAKIIRNKTTLVYVFIGVLNCSLALLGIILFSLNHADMAWLNKSLANLLVGFLIITDGFFLNWK